MIDHLLLALIAAGVLGQLWQMRVGAPLCASKGAQQAPHVAPSVTLDAGEEDDPDPPPTQVLPGKQRCDQCQVILPRDAIRTHLGAWRCREHKLAS